MRHLDALISEVEVWSARNFPDGSLEGIATHLAKEHTELQYAVSEYLGPWSNLDGPFSPARAAQVGDMRRNDLLDEIADNVVLLIRLSSALGGDFLDVVWNKWEVVRERDYLAYPGRGRPESNDDRPIIDRSSTDPLSDAKREGIIASALALRGERSSTADPWIVSTTIFYDDDQKYLARERESRVYHLTAKPKSAFAFESREDAESVIASLSWLGTGDGPPLKAVRLGDVPVQALLEADAGDWVDDPVLGRVLTGDSAKRLLDIPTEEAE